MGADTRLLNGYVNVNGYKYLYQEWYDIKKMKSIKLLRNFFISLHIYFRTTFIRHNVIFNNF